MTSFFSSVVTFVSYSIDVLCFSKKPGEGQCVTHDTAQWIQWVSVKYDCLEPTHGLWNIAGTLSLRGVLTFVASGLDINGCVLRYFEGTAHLHCYTSCILTALRCSQVSFLHCCHMKRFMKCDGVYSLLWYAILWWWRKVLLDYITLHFLMSL